MADRAHVRLPVGSDLFTGLKFWLSQQVPLRSYYVKKSRERGAIIVAQETQADLCIVDDLKKPPATGFTYHSYKFIEDSIRANDLQEYKQYVVGLRSAVDRPVGSATIASKATRNPFTKADDQLLYNWLEPYRQSGGSWKGNEIYKQLARQHPNHTFQSWRTRFLSVVSKATDLTVTETIDRYAEPNDQIATPPPERSPKRRRFDAPQQSDTQDPSRTPRNEPARVISLERRDSLDESHSRSERLVDPAKSDDDKMMHENSQEIQNQLEGGLGDVQRDGPASPERLPQLALVDENRISHHHRQGKQNGMVAVDVKDDILRNDQNSDSDSVEHTQAWDQTQPIHVSQAFEEASRLQKFTLKEVRQLYQAVPSIHGAKLDKLDESWEGVAEAWGNHTAAEWRIFHETIVLPEYMRRHSLKTKEDLDAHVSNLLNQGQDLLTPVPGMEEQPSSETDSESHMHDTTQKHVNGKLAQATWTENTSDAISENSRSQRESHHSSTSIHDAMSSLEPRTGSQLIEVRETTRVQLSPRAALSHRLSSPSEAPASQTSAKKRLFGRSLKAELLSSQIESFDVVADLGPSRGQPLGTASAVSAITSSNSITLSESKQPPESGQRPPKSTTASQEEDLARTAAKHTIEETTRSTYTTAVVEQSIGTMAHSDSAFRGGSPALNLMSDPIVDDSGERGSSPAPSDTGSEYMAFDTAPTRSQLWDLGESDTDKNADFDNNADGHESEGFRIIQHSSHDTPPRRLPTDDGFGQSDSSASEKSFLGEDDMTGEDPNILKTAEVEGSPELDVQMIASRHTVPRTDTQYLFQQSLPQVEDETTLFNLPSPEGGWEQFGDLEDELDEVRTSVELAEDDPLEHIAPSSASHANEVAAELPYIGDFYRKNLQVDKAPSIHSEETDLTTFSQNNRISEVSAKPPQAGQSDRVSRSTPRLNSSHTASDSMTEDGADNQESSDPSPDEAAIKLWLSEQTFKYDHIGRQNATRFASIALQATVLNLSAATFTLRDMISAYERSEADRKSRFEQDNRLKRELTDGTPVPRLKSKIKLTEEEAKGLLPKDVLGVWTIEDDEDFMSRAVERIKRVERKHGAVGVRRRMSFLRVRYGVDSLDDLSPSKRKR